MYPLQRAPRLLRVGHRMSGLCTLETLLSGSALSALKDKKDGAIRLQAEWNRVYTPLRRWRGGVFIKLLGGML